MAGSPLKRARREAAERAAALAAGLGAPGAGVALMPAAARRTEVVQPARLSTLRAPLVPADVAAKAPRDLTFREFRLRYFGLESYWHHLQIIEAIESAGPMEVVMVLCPPEHGKTTLIEDYICFRAAMDPNIRITVMSEGQPHAKKLLRRVKFRMTDVAFRAYQEDFGPFHEDGSDRPWTTEYMVVDGATNDERDYTVESRGSTSAVAGTRADLLLPDDIQSLRNLSSTESLVSTIRQDHLTRVGGWGRTVFVGTRVGMGDVYESLQDAGVVDRLVMLPATDGVLVPCELGDRCAIGDVPHERPLCPEMWSAHQLAKRRRQVGEPVWWRNYQQAPQRAGDGTFTLEMWARACDPERVVKPLAGPPICPVVFGLDPGMGRTGHTSLMAAMLTPGRLELLDMEDVSGFSRLEQIPDLVRSMAPLYRPSLLIIETDAMQQGIARMDAMRQVAAEFGFSIYEHRSGGEKADATLGLMAMAGGFNAGEIGVPAGDEFSVRRFEVLHDQLLGWRHDIGKNFKCDSAMALWFIWKYFSEMRAVWTAKTSDWSYRAMPNGLRPVSRQEALRR